MKRIVIALTVVLAHLCVLAGANVKSARIGSLRASQTVVTNVTGAVSQSDVDAAISASNLIGRADARRDFVGTNKANSVGSGFSIVDAGGSSVLGIGKDETDSDVWRGGLYAKGVIDDYGTKKYGVKLEKNEYSPRRGRVCVRDLDHYYYEPIASINDATNAAYQVVTNAVGDGYLCTVAAAEAMVDEETQNCMRYTEVEGVKHIEYDNLYFSPSKSEEGSVTFGPVHVNFLSSWSQLEHGSETLPEYLASLAWHPSDVCVADYGITNAYTKEEADAKTKELSIRWAYDTVTNCVEDGYIVKTDDVYTKSDADDTFAKKTGSKFDNGTVEVSVAESDYGLSVYGNKSEIGLGYDGERPKFVIGQKNEKSYFKAWGCLADSDMFGWITSDIQVDGSCMATSNMASRVATNAAEAVVGDVLQYALTNITDNTERFELESGTIGNLYLDGDHTNIWLTLQYPARNDRASDTLLRVVCVSNTTLAISSAYTDVDGSGWQNVPKGTNTIAATRVAFKDGRSIVNVSVKSW